MKEIVMDAVKAAVCAAKYLEKPESIQFICNAAAMIADCFTGQGKILIAGNGGSLCDAMHFAEELTGQFRKRRPALAAIALSDSAHMSCTANDMGFEEVFSRGIEAYGQPQDIAIFLTTSGNSINLLRAYDMAVEKKLKTIAFLGKDGGRLRGLAELEWIVDGFATSDRIQEAHMAAIHIIIELIERQLFGTKEVLVAAKH